MGRGIAAGLLAVVTPPDNLSVTNDHSSDRDLAVVEGLFRFLQRKEHVEFVTGDEFSVLVQGVWKLRQSITSAWCEALGSRRGQAASEDVDVI